MIYLLLTLILIAVLYSTNKGEDFLVSTIVNIIVIPLKIVLFPLRLIFPPKTEAEVIIDAMNKRLSLNSSKNILKEHDDEKSLVITCGKCGKQNRQERNLGAVIIECPQCNRKSQVTT